MGGNQNNNTRRLESADSILNRKFGLYSKEKLFPSKAKKESLGIFNDIKLKIVTTNSMFFCGCWMFRL